MAFRLSASLGPLAITSNTSFFFLGKSIEEAFRREASFGAYQGIYSHGFNWGFRGSRENPFSHFVPEMGSCYGLRAIML
jgi:hypothetical protein